MKKILLKQMIIIVLSCCLLSCAATNEEPNEPGDAWETRGGDCISQMSIRDYQVLDESNLIVTGTARRKYHIVLSRRAFGLRSTWRLAFQSSTGQVCSAFSDLIVDDGMGVDRIRIRSVRQLTPEEYDDLLVRFGKKEPDVKQTPEPVPIEGAEVEELD
ncbi:MAG: DUF6491 family protein [Gammaproteobacteria bacterium]|nr:DUF6491 family protein [Gammaproteobacteria bacterium]MDH3415049.1 DUF6491 family protein [Gammaproteobacteria bacterium]